MANRIPGLISSLVRTGVSISAALMLASATPGLAQQADSGEEATDAIGQPYLLELSGDWQIICVRSEFEHDQCSMGQDLTDQQGGQVAQIRIISLPPGGQTSAAVNLSTPLATLLSREITLSVDGGPARSYGFTYCTTEFCLSSFGLTEDQVNEMRRGGTAQWTIFAVQAPDQPVTLDSSLTGFTAAFQRVTELNALFAEAVQAARSAQ